MLPADAGTGSDDEDEMFVVTAFKTRSVGELDPFAMRTDEIERWKRTEIEHYNILLTLREDIQQSLQVLGQTVGDFLSFKDLLFGCVKKPLPVETVRDFVLLSSNLYLEFCSVVDLVDRVHRSLFVQSDNENYDFVSYRLLMRQYIKLEQIVRKYEDDLAISLNQLGKMSPELDKMNSENKMLAARNEVLLKRTSELEKENSNLHKQLAETYLHKGKNAIRQIKATEEQSKKEIERINTMFHTEIGSMGFRLEQFEKTVGSILAHPDNRLNEDSQTKLHAMRIHLTHLTKKFKNVDQSIRVLQAKMKDMMKKHISGAKVEMKLVKERKGYNLKMKYARRNLENLGDVTTELQRAAGLLGVEVLSRKNKRRVAGIIRHNMGGIQRVLEVVNDILKPINPKKSLASQMGDLPTLAAMRDATKDMTPQKASSSSSSGRSSARRRRRGRGDAGDRRRRGGASQRAPPPAAAAASASDASADPDTAASSGPIGVHRMERTGPKSDRSSLDPSVGVDENGIPLEPGAVPPSSDASSGGGAGRSSGRSRKRRMIHLDDVKKNYVPRKQHVAEVAKLFQRMKTQSVSSGNRIQKLEKALARTKQLLAANQKKLALLAQSADGHSKAVIGDISTFLDASVSGLSVIPPKAQSRPPPMHDLPIKHVSFPGVATGPGRDFPSDPKASAGKKTDGASSRGSSRPGSKDKTRRRRSRPPSRAAQSSGPRSEAKREREKKRRRRSPDVVSDSDSDSVSEDDPEVERVHEEKQTLARVEAETVLAHLGLDKGSVEELLETSHLEFESPEDLERHQARIQEKLQLLFQQSGLEEMGGEEIRPKVGELGDIEPEADGEIVGERRQRRTPPIGSVVGGRETSPIASTTSVAADPDRVGRAQPEKALPRQAAMLKATEAVIKSVRLAYEKSKRQQEKVIREEERKKRREEKREERKKRHAAAAASSSGSTSAASTSSQHQQVEDRHQREHHAFRVPTAASLEADLKDLKDKKDAPAQMKDILLKHIENVRKVLSGSDASDPSLPQLGEMMESLSSKLEVLQSAATGKVNKSRRARQARRRRTRMQEKKKPAKGRKPRMVDVGMAAFGASRGLSGTTRNSFVRRRRGRPPSADTDAPGFSEKRRRKQEDRPPSAPKDNVVKLPALFRPYDGPPAGFKKMLHGVDVGRVLQQYELFRDGPEDDTVRIGSPDQE